MTADDLWLGIDIGTQSVKALLVDDRGSVAGSGWSALTSVRVDGRHEQDPESWVEATALAIREALRGQVREGGGATAASRIRGLAICSTSGTLAVVDDGGMPVAVGDVVKSGRGVLPGIMYDDARAARLLDEVRDSDPETWDRLGFRIQATWALPKIVWLQREGLLDGRRHVAYQADVVASRMIGSRVATDWSHALKSGYDLIAERWPSLALARLRLDETALPSVVAPGSVLGATSEEWADRTGLPAGIPVHAGMTDGCAAQISAGTLRLGDWHTVVGTTLVVKSVADHLVTDDAGAVYSHRAPDSTLWYPGGASSVGAGALTSVLGGVDLEAMTERAEEHFRGRLDAIPLCYPLVTTGERFPVVRPDALGFVALGERRLPLAEAAASLDPEILLASVLFGVALVERLCLDTVTGAGAPVTGRLSSSGGGTKNPWWVQLRADVLGRAISVPRIAEGALGMAVLAAWGAAAGAGIGIGSGSGSGTTLAEVADRMSLVDRTVEPSAAGSAADYYDRFLAELRDLGWVAP